MTIDEFNQLHGTTTVQALKIILNNACRSSNVDLIQHFLNVPHIRAYLNSAILWDGLHIAIKNEQISVVKILIPHIDSNLQSHAFKTACACGKRTIMDYFLESQYVCVSAESVEYAIRSLQPEIIEYILERLSSFDASLQEYVYNGIEWNTAINGHQVIMYVLTHPILSPLLNCSDRNQDYMRTLCQYGQSDTMHAIWSDAELAARFPFNNGELWRDIPGQDCDTFAVVARYNTIMPDEYTLNNWTHIALEYGHLDAIEGAMRLWHRMNPIRYHEFLPLVEVYAHEQRRLAWYERIATLDHSLDGDTQETPLML